MEKYRTYKYLLYPTENQMKLIDEIIAKCIFLRSRYQKDLNDGVEIPKRNMDIIAFYRKQFPDLEKCDTSALINEVFKVRDEKERRIKRIKNSYTTNYYDYLQTHYPLSNEKIFLSRVGWVKKGAYHPIPKEVVIRNFTVVREKMQKYYVLINVTLPECPDRKLDPDSIIGLDYSSPHFAVDSDGNNYDLPHFYRDEYEKISKKQKRLCHLQKGSYRSRELIRQIQKEHCRIRARRRDTLQKLSTELANKYDYIVIESLEMKKMKGFKNITKATYDNGFWQFTSMLEYKMNERKKKLIRIDHWYPSTKTCSNCGYVNKNINLNTHIWICPECNAILDRDFNAAINIRNEGKKMILAGGQLARH